MSCISRRNICIVRGDNYAMDVGLAEGFDEIADDPTDFVGRLVVKLDFNDDLPSLLELTATPEPTTDADDCDGALAYLSFAAHPTQTQSLPPYDLVYFVEVSNVGGSEVTRLFQGKVDIHD